jgi:hypothetical protein
MANLAFGIIGGGEMKSLPLKLYDPRKGESFELSFGKWSFSSLSSGFLVLDGHSEVDAEMFSALISQCVHATSSRAFTVVRPWVPGARNLLEQLSAKFPDMVETEGARCVFSAPAAFVEVLAIRKAVGGSNSGEWIFGGCIDPHASELLDFHALPLVSLLRHSEEIGCLLSFGEHGQLTFITRLFDGVDAIAAEIAALAIAP